MSREQKHTPGPWKAHFDVPNAVIEGHIIKADHGAKCPIASLWVGGGMKGKPTQIANARLIAAAPDMAEKNKRLSSRLRESGKSVNRLEKSAKKLMVLIHRHCDENCGLAPHGECRVCVFGKVSERKSLCPVEGGPV